MRTQSGQLRRRDRALGCQVGYKPATTALFQLSHLSLADFKPDLFKSQKVLETGGQCSGVIFQLFHKRIALTTPYLTLYFPLLQLNPSIIMAPLEFCRVVRQEGGREEPIRALAGDKYGPTGNGYQLYKECTLFVPL